MKSKYVVVEEIWISMDDEGRNIINTIIGTLSQGCSEEIF